MLLPRTQGGFVMKVYLSWLGYDDGGWFTWIQMYLLVALQAGGMC